MNPLFSVGEVVILRSSNYSELNGEYPVLLIIYGLEGYTCPITNQYLISGDEGINYVLDMDFMDSDGTCNQWVQSSLRKKHQPSEQSFTELMQAIKSPVSV
jgi:hypothetical protein